MTVTGRPASRSLLRTSSNSGSSARLVTSPVIDQALGRVVAGVLDDRVEQVLVVACVAMEQQVGGAGQALVEELRRVRAGEVEQVDVGAVDEAQRHLGDGYRLWIPHSVLAWPAQRPSRSSPSAPGRRVHGSQPMLV
jgi:hypothetical protein